jgi:hypothetical protein
MGGQGDPVSLLGSRRNALANGWEGAVEMCAKGFVMFQRSIDNFAAKRET